MSQVNDALIGQVLSGRFEVIEHIASGGMGSVFKAIQRPLNRIVAIKVMDHVDDHAEEFQRRFFLEASMCARLNHPNIVRIFDYGCHDNSVFFIAMEFLEGQTLKQLLEAVGPLPPTQAIGFIKQVAAALVEAHGAHLVHRDLKPSNLFVTTDGLGIQHAKILDFGVVKQISEDHNVTQVGLTLGSPWYMSPEQIQDGAVDGRSDLYSLGIVLYQLLTSRLPFSAKEPFQVLIKHLQEVPPPMVEVNPGVTISADLEGLVFKMLKKSPDDRYQSARDLIAAFNTLETTGISTPNTAQAQPTNLGPSAVYEMETQVLTLAELDASRSTTPIEPEETPHTGSLLELQAIPQDSFIAYIDFNCPYCFALHERVLRWDLSDKVNWCMIEHSSHILDGPFDLHQEQLLSTEVVEVHHRAPDVDLMLPAQRCRSTFATRLQAYVQREFYDKRHDFRRDVFRALWQAGKDIGEPEVLAELLDRHGIPSMFLELCEEEPPENTTSQKAWQEGDYDASIPVLTDPVSGRVLIGLPDERTLKAFFLGIGSRVLDSGACYYQQQPSVLVSGWMSHLWPILADIRGCCELLQAPTSDRTREMLSEIAVPDLLIIEAGHTTAEEIAALAQLSRARSVPWVVATQTPSPEEEIQVLSMGALEYLPAIGDAQVARARLNRILRDRYNLEHRVASISTDTLTNLSTRHSLLGSLRSEWERALRTQDSISLILLDLDGFKAFNQAHGYLAGNAALTRISEQLGREIRGAGTDVARFSGNEFAVLLTGHKADATQDIAQRLKRAIAELGIQNRASNNGGVLTASVGHATAVPSDETSVYTLVDSAAAEIKAQRQRSRQA
jgi:diguanylate cyclase (GGDEF)-like protein